jgi:N-acetyl-gamma-glutamyl-phosphate reductase
MTSHSPDAPEQGMTPPARVPVGIVGGSGYTGQELARLLSAHPGVELVWTTSRGEAGQPSPVSGLVYTAPDPQQYGEVAVVFLCLPHGEARAWVDAHGHCGARIIDLTADHRPGSGHDADAVFGLNEWNRAAMRDARLVANPGCYPTGVLLALLPLVQAGAIDTERLINIQAASGVTGAGRTARVDLLFSEVAENFRAYGWGNGHRHLLEMRALLPGLDLLFQPHLLPVTRGILETITLPLAPGWSAEGILEAWRRRYWTEPVIRVRPEGLPALAEVIHTDRLILGAVDVAQTRAPVATLGVALDNLGKGAAGQAVQNLNAFHDWPTGLGVRIP